MPQHTASAYSIRSPHRVFSVGFSLYVSLSAGIRVRVIGDSDRDFENVSYRVGKRVRVSDRAMPWRPCTWGCPGPSGPADTPAQEPLPAIQATVRVRVRVRVRAILNRYALLGWTPVSIRVGIKVRTSLPACYARCGHIRVRVGIKGGVAMKCQVKRTDGIAVEVRGIVRIRAG